MEEKMLRELLAITRENNEILRSLNLQRRWVNFFWFFKWFVIAAIAYSAYQAASPYIDQAQATYNQAQSALNSINTLNTNINASTQQLQNIDQKSFTNFLQQEIKKRMGQ
jgi:predicted PurR-regulated permease PerM